MRDSLHFTETANELVIEIKPPVKKVITLGLTIQGLVIGGLGVALVLGAWLAISYSVGATVLACVVGFLYLLAGKSYLQGINRREIVKVTRQNILVIETNAIAERRREFPLNQIKQLYIAGNQEFTSHPMAPGSTNFDVFGLETTDKQIQYLIADGTIALVCNGKVERFGKRIGSWDGEEIIARIEAFTGRKWASIPAPEPVE
ncbi:MAG TPA: hypothetical protein VG603_03230 [Chitinophagales bacterium]|nr:hypothetical protein [Chitinophagales bacterium]